MFIAVALSASLSAGEWTNLFNGKNLNGWIQKNGTATYRIEGDAITGKTNEGSPNSFLCTKKLYGDLSCNLKLKSLTNLIAAFKFVAKRNLSQMIALWNSGV